MIKTSYFGASESIKVIDVYTSEKLVTCSAWYDKQHLRIYNHFHARRANSGKITTF